LTELQQSTHRSTAELQCRTVGGNEEESAPSDLTLKNKDKSDSVTVSGDSIGLSLKKEIQLDRCLAIVVVGVAVVSVWLLCLHELELLFLIHRMSISLEQHSILLIILLIHRQRPKHPIEETK